MVGINDDDVLATVFAKKNKKVPSTKKMAKAKRKKLLLIYPKERAPRPMASLDQIETEEGK